ncbi:hypothetical protein KM043_010830 [Ampulex compressa]|nr:hypothetical protein KM043_010830 [Ampulex compressa]
MFVYRAVFHSSKVTPSLGWPTSIVFEDEFVHTRRSEVIKRFEDRNDGPKCLSRSKASRVYRVLRGSKVGDYDCSGLRSTKAYSQLPLSDLVVLLESPRFVARSTEEGRSG